MAKKKILIIEDDAFLLELCSRKIKEMNFEILEATDGESGLEIIRKEKPDLVLLDLGLPKMDGMEVLKRVRKDPKTKQIKVLIFSNYSDRQKVKEGLGLEVSDYLIKAHFTLDEVVEKIQKLLGVL